MLRNGCFLPMIRFVKGDVLSKEMFNTATRCFLSTIISDSLSHRMFLLSTPPQLLAVVLPQVDATHDEQMRMTLIGVKVRRRRHKNTEDRVLMLNPSAEVCGTRVIQVFYCFELSGCFDLCGCFGFFCGLVFFYCFEFFYCCEFFFCFDLCGYSDFFYCVDLTSCFDFADCFD